MPRLFATSVSPCVLAGVLSSNSIFAPMCRLQMRNCGSVPVHGLDVQWSCEEGGESPHLALQTEQLLASLPLEPGQQLTAPLLLRGQLLSSRSDDCLSVAGSESRWSASGVISDVLYISIRKWVGGCERKGKFRGKIGS